VPALVGLCLGVTSACHPDHGEGLAWSVILSDFVGSTVLFGAPATIAGVVMALAIREHRPTGRS